MKTDVNRKQEEKKMKKAKYLIIAVVSAVFAFNANGQNILNNFIEEDTIVRENFDTMIVFHEHMFDTCMAWSAPNWLYNYIGQYYDSYVYATKKVDWSSPYNHFHLDGTAFGSNKYHIQGLAQPYHFDSLTTLIGVCARPKVNLDSEPRNDEYYFRIYDTAFNELAKCEVFILPSQYHMFDQYDPPKFRLYFFSEDEQKTVQVKDFFVGADVNDLTVNKSRPNYAYNYANCIFDTVWQNITIGCQAQYSPYFKKDGVWKSFADDTVYTFYQKSYIELLPVILIPHPQTDTTGVNPEDSTNNGIEDVLLRDNTWIYPNPASTQIHIACGFRIQSAEFYNQAGAKVMQVAVNSYEAEVDISTLAKGTYIVVLNTVHGKVSPRIIVN